MPDEINNSFFYRNWNDVKQSERYLVVEAEAAIFAHYPPSSKSIYKYLSQFFGGWHFWIYRQYPKSFPNIVKLFAFYGIDQYSDLSRLNPRLIHYYESELEGGAQAREALRSELFFICSLPVDSPLGQRLSCEQYDAFFSIKSRRNKANNQFKISESKPEDIFSDLEIRINALPKARDIEFISRRVGFINGTNGETLEAIGESTGISRERVRQVVQRRFEPILARSYRNYELEITEALNDARKTLGFVFLPSEICTQYEVFRFLDQRTHLLEILIKHHTKSSGHDHIELVKYGGVDYFFADQRKLDKYKRHAKEDRNAAQMYLQEHVFGDEKRRENITNLLEQTFSFRRKSYAQAIQEIISELIHPVTESQLIFSIQNELDRKITPSRARSVINIVHEYAVILGTRPSLWGGRRCLRASDQKIKNFCDEVFKYIVEEKGEKYYFDVADPYLQIMRKAEKHENLLQYGKYSVFAALAFDPLGRFQVKRNMCSLSINSDPIPKIADLSKSILKKAQKPLSQKQIFEEIRRIRSTASAQMHESETVLATGDGK